MIKLRFHPNFYNLRLKVFSPANAHLKVSYIIDTRWLYIIVLPIKPLTLTEYLGVRRRAELGEHGGELDTPSSQRF